MREVTKGLKVFNGSFCPDMFAVGLSHCFHLKVCIFQLQQAHEH